MRVKQASNGKRSIHPGSLRLKFYSRSYQISQDITLISLLEYHVTLTHTSADHA